MCVLMTVDVGFYLCQGGSVFISISSFRGYTKNCLADELGVKVAHGPRQKPLDFGGNLEHVTLGLSLGLR